MTKMLYQVTILVLGVSAVLSLPDDKYHLDKSKFQQKKIPYSFSYGVKDDYKGTYFDRKEKSSGNQVVGSYTVQLPDGRHQTVKYTADHYNGFRAIVSYHGVAHYPPPSKYQSPFTVKPTFYNDHSKPLVYSDKRSHSHKKSDHHPQHTDQSLHFITNSQES